MRQSHGPEELFARPLLRAMADALVEIPDAARQDGLDFLALLAGLKRTCLIGRGFADNEFSSFLSGLAATAGLPTHMGAGWEPMGVLPVWYLEASARRRARQDLLYICADEAAREEVAALCGKGRVTAAEEAALLSYPLCCVEAHHRRTLEIEKLHIEWAGEDIERAARLIAAGLEPRPQAAADWARLEALVATTHAACTSVAMCAACIADHDGAAARMSRRYRDLARAAGYRI